MKSDSQISWQTGTYHRDNNYFEWKDGPHTAPFDFQIKSTDAQVIDSWSIINSLNDRDSATMTQTFGSAYTEEDTSGSVSAVQGVAIAISVLVACGIIGLCICCMIKRRKMAKAVGFEEEIEHSKEKPMKTESDATPEDGNDAT